MFPLFWSDSLTVSSEGNDRIKHVTLTGQTETNGPLCLCVNMLVHTPSSQQVSQAGLVAINLLSQQEKSDLNAAIMLQRKKREKNKLPKVMEKAD